MTSPETSRDHFLATVTEVRRALAVVPRLIESGRYQEAWDLVEDLGLQLTELQDDEYGFTEWGQQILDPVLARLELADSAVALELSVARTAPTDPPLTRPGGRPGEPPMNGYADVPLY